MRKLPIEFQCGCFLIEEKHPSSRAEIKFRLCIEHSSNLDSFLKQAGLKRVSGDPTTPKE